MALVNPSLLSGVETTNGWARGVGEWRHAGMETKTLDTSSIQLTWLYVELAKNIQW
jgi:hypothetical protein